MLLTNERKKQYRAIGHGLNPIVTIAGNGLSEPVVEELNRALEDHELIKVKLMIVDRDLRKQTIEKICRLARAESVQEIGKVVLLYRASKQPNPRLSNLKR